MATLRDIIVETPATDNAVDNVTALATRVFREGYRAGFLGSGEGWNGEYPFADHMNEDTDRHRKRMKLLQDQEDYALAAFLKSVV